MSVFVRWLFRKFVGSKRQVLLFAATVPTAPSEAVAAPVALEVSAEANSSPDQTPPSTLNLRRARPYLFAARLRCVAKLNPPKGRRLLPAKIRAKLKSMKVSPQLFPVKRQKLVAIRPVTKIILARPVRKSAIIIPLPTGAQRAALIRAKRAA